MLGPSSVENNDYLRSHLDLLESLARKSIDLGVHHVGQVQASFVRLLKDTGSRRFERRVVHLQRFLENITLRREEPRVQPSTSTRPMFTVSMSIPPNAITTTPSQVHEQEYVVVNNENSPIPPTPLSSSSSRLPSEVRRSTSLRAQRYDPISHHVGFRSARSLLHSRPESTISTQSQVIENTTASRSRMVNEGISRPVGGSENRSVEGDVVYRV